MRVLPSKGRGGLDDGNHWADEEIRRSRMGQRWAPGEHSSSRTPTSSSAGKKGQALGAAVGTGALTSSGATEDGVSSAL